MRRVIVESPYDGRDSLEVSQNIHYARAAHRDCLDRGEAPFASHLLYTQSGVLRDSDPVERQQGISAGIEWGNAAEATVVYHDLGISAGMEQGIQQAQEALRPVEFRSIKSWQPPYNGRRGRA